MKNIVILGSTGSIGRNALRVAEALPSRFRVTGLAARRDYRLLLRQAERFGVRRVAMADPAAAEACAAAAPRGVRVWRGPEGVEALAALGEADLVLCAVEGVAGLKPVMAAVKRGTDVALATKEVLVAAGEIVTRACARSGARLLPVDSEHSAIFQCLASAGQVPPLAGPPEGVRRLVLTASGGPFGLKPRVNLNRVTVRQALAHPQWNMGRKVTVDSATLMNKGLEILEAHWLFKMPLERIDVVIHPESIVHSLVEFADGAMMAQLSLPDMRFAIQYALTYPERVEGGLPSTDLVRAGSLSFRAPDPARFPCLALAREAAARGGSLPAVMNAANEVAVRLFLEEKIGFSGIWRVVERVVDRHRVVKHPDIDGIIEADAWARAMARTAGRRQRKKRGA